MTAFFEIVNGFLRNEPYKKKWNSRVGKSSPYGSGGSLYAAPGTLRMSYDDHTLYSYEHWAIAIKLMDSKFVLVNGDNGPTNNTRKHQNEFRSGLSRNKTEHAFVPFSALRAASITEIREIKIVATTPDRVEVKELPCKRTFCQEKGAHTHPTNYHFLGETLFFYRGRFYVSGLDRNDDPRKRNFFLARLPANLKKAPKSVDEALKILRPKGLSKNALRQGEWFFDPVNIKPTTKTFQKRIPIISDKSEDVNKALVEGSWEHVRLQRRTGRHMATRMYVNGHVYVSGMVRDNEHNALKLGNGKTWFRVVRNLSDGGWNATGGVD